MCLKANWSRSVDKLYTRVLVTIDIVDKHDLVDKHIHEYLSVSYNS
jgi:hypothetical protein